MEDNDKFKQKQIKVTLLGASGVGKTSILQCYVNQKFQSTTTVGASYFPKTIKYKGDFITFNIWDTGGQEKYHSLANMYYRDADVILLVYDISDKKSFEQLKLWHQEFIKNGPENSMVCVVGNKYDLVQQEQVLYQDVIKYVDENQCLFCYCSAKNNQGIDQIFELIVKEMEANKQQMSYVSSIILKLKNQEIIHKDQLNLNDMKGIKISQNQSFYNQKQEQIQNNKQNFQQQRCSC